MIIFAGAKRKGDGRPERQDIVCSVRNRIRRVHKYIVRDGLYMI